MQGAAKGGVVEGPRARTNRRFAPGLAGRRKQNPLPRWLQLSRSWQTHPLPSLQRIFTVRYTLSSDPGATAMHQ